MEKWLEKLAQITKNVSDAIIMDLRVTPDYGWEKLILNYCGAASSLADDVVHLLSFEKTQAAAIVSRSMIEACVHCINLSKCGYIYANTMQQTALSEYLDDIKKVMNCQSTSQTDKTDTLEKISSVSDHIKRIDPKCADKKGKIITKLKPWASFELADMEQEYMTYRNLCKFSHVDLLNIVRFNDIEGDAIMLNPPGTLQDKLAIAIATSEFLLKAIVSIFTYFKVDSTSLKSAVAVHNELCGIIDSAASHAGESKGRHIIN